MVRQGPGLASTEAAWARAAHGAGSHRSFGHAFGTNFASHVASAFGAHGAAQIGRAVSHIQIGSALTGQSMGAMAAAAGPAIVALGALAVAAKLVEVGFGTLMSSATTLVGAIAQIGGAKGLQDMFVESASVEKMSASIAANTTDNMSRRDIMDMIGDISKNSEFDQTQVAGMINAYKSKTGTVKEMSGAMGQFTANLASVGNLTPEQAGNLMGQLKTQFPGLGNEGTMQAAKNLWGLGRSGSVELRDATSITQALGFASKASPDVLKGLNLEMGMVQLAQKFTGGQDASQAVTGVRRIQEDLLNTASGGKKRAAFEAILGKGFLTHSDTGESVLSNAPRTMAQLTLAEYEGKIPTSLIESRGQKALRGMGESAQFTSGMGEKEKLDVLENIFKKFEEGSMIVDEFDGALKEVKDTVDYQFKQMFNEMSVEIEGQLLPVLKEMQPVIKLFVDQIVSNKDEVGEYFINLASWLGTFVEIMPTVVSVMGELATAVAKAIAIITGKPSSKEDAQKAVDDAQARIDKKNPFDLPFIEEDRPRAEKDKQDALAALKMWQGIEDMSPENMKKTVAEKADAARKLAYQASLAHQNAEGNASVETPAEVAARQSKSGGASTYGSDKHAETIIKQNDQQIKLMQIIADYNKRTSHNTAPILAPPSGTRDGN